MDGYNQDLRHARRRLAELDREIYARSELIRYARDDKRDDTEQRIANYRAEMETLEGEADDWRYLLSVEERHRENNEIGSRTSWPAAWQAVFLLFAIAVLFLFAVAVARL